MIICTDATTPREATFVLVIIQLIGTSATCGDVSVVSIEDIMVHTVAIMTNPNGF